MKRLGIIAALVLCVLAAGAGGYVLGRHSHRAVQITAVNANTGHTHWVTLTKAGCTLPSPHYLGEAVCSFFDQLRVAP